MALKVPGGADVSRGVLDRWSEAARAAEAKGLVWAKRGEDGWSSSIDKFVGSERWEAAGRSAAAGPGDLLLVVADRLRRTTESETWEDFAQANADLLAKGSPVIRELYLTKTLASARARETCLLPNRLPQRQ